jgi:hypothetical protein
MKTSGLTIHQYIDRSSGAVKTERLVADRLVNLLYDPGRERMPVLFKTLTAARASRWLGWTQYDRPCRSPRAAARRLARSLEVDLSECCDATLALSSPRRLFERQIRYWECRPQPDDPAVVTSPADARLLVTSLAATSLFFIFNKDIGFLPGDIQSKLDPYMQPLYDNLAVIQDGVGGQSGMGRRIREMLAEEKIVITALAYIRGRSLVKTYFIVDEAQNLTPHEVKTIITRAGEGTKVVFTGDVFQIDHPYLDSHSNGLSYLIEKMKAQPLAAHAHLEKGERSELSELAARLL